MNTTNTQVVTRGRFILVILFIVVLIAFFASTFKIIHAGEVAAVARFGRIKEQVLYPGAHIVIPFIDQLMRYDTKLVVYETRVSQDLNYDFDEANSVYVDIPVDTNTKDGQRVDIFYTVRFAVDPKKVTWVAQNVGNEDALVGKIVKTESRIWTRNIPRDYEAASLYSGNVIEIQQKIADRLRPVFEQNGIILNEFGIREIKFNAEYVKAIETKQIEAVKVETARNKAEQAKYEKEQRITQAEGQAQEQALQKETLTSELLQKMQIEKWDGKYPQYMVTGQNGQSILPLPSKQ